MTQVIKKTSIERATCMFKTFKDHQEKIESDIVSLHEEYKKAHDKLIRRKNRSIHLKIYYNNELVKLGSGQLSGVGL